MTPPPQLSMCAMPPSLETDGAWRSTLRTRLKEQPYPFFVFAEGMIPAASIWSGARLWTHAFRELGLVPGDRVALSLPPSAAWLQVFVAALWEGLTIAPLPALTTEEALQGAMEAVDARVALSLLDTTLPGVCVPQHCEGPGKLPTTLRQTRHTPTPTARFLLKTSGTSGHGGKWIALSDANIWHVLQSHLPHLGLVEGETRVLSVLPWHHAFGLIIDLLPAILSGAEITRDPHSGRDAASLLALAESMGSNYLCAVPLQLKKLMQQEAGRDFLQRLQGGVVGGAPVDAKLTALLRTTRLRVGYGQTEASPGIALGEPGYWPAPGYLGRPLDCETHQDSDHILQFRGANAYLGTWNASEGLQVLPAERWVDTGDYVHATPNGDLFFAGRSDDAFKLSNGRRVEAGTLELQIKASFPEIEEALLWTPDGETLHLCLMTSSAMHYTPDDFLPILDSLTHRLVTVQTLPVGFWIRTGKGTIDRASTIGKLQYFR